jgi:predicted aspartyl protease
VVYKYSQRFDPPAPVMTLSVIVPLSAQRALVEGLVDSGADISVVPINVVRNLRLSRVDFALVSALEQGTREVAVYAAAVGIDGVLTPTVQRVIAWERDYALLGRDILNRLLVLMNGPERRLEVRV